MFCASSSSSSSASSFADFPALMTAPSFSYFKNSMPNDQMKMQQQQQQIQQQSHNTQPPALWPSMCSHFIPPAALASSSYRSSQAFCSSPSVSYPVPIVPAAAAEQSAAAASFLIDTQRSSNDDAFFSGRKRKGDNNGGNDMEDDHDENELNFHGEEARRVTRKTGLQSSPICSSNNPFHLPSPESQVMMSMQHEQQHHQQLQGFQFQQQDENYNNQYNNNNNNASFDDAPMCGKKRDRFEQNRAELHSDKRSRDGQPYVRVSHEMFVLEAGDAPILAGADAGDDDMWPFKYAGKC